MSKTKKVKWTEAFCLEEAQAMLAMIKADYTIYNKKALTEARGYSANYFADKLNAHKNNDSLISKEIKEVLYRIEGIIEVRLTNIGLPGHSEAGVAKSIFLLRNWFGFDKAEQTNVTINLPPPAISPKVNIPNEQNNG